MNPSPPLPDRIKKSKTVPSRSLNPPPTHTTRKQILYIFEFSHWSGDRHCLNSLNPCERGVYQTQAVGLESETDTTAGSVNWSDVTVVTSSVKAGTGNCCRIVAVPCGTKLNLVALSQHRNCHCRHFCSLKTTNDCKLVGVT